MNRGYFLCFATLSSFFFIYVKRLRVFFLDRTLCKFWYYIIIILPEPLVGVVSLMAWTNHCSQDTPKLKFFRDLTF